MNPTKFSDDFKQTLDPRWIQTITGGGSLNIKNSVLNMSFSSSNDQQYTDVQIDDYNMLPRKAYPWKAPLRMTVRARSSHPAATPESTSKTKEILRGTTGFGFWNNPFSVRGDVLALPEAVWFFYAAPPSNMALVPGIPGWGWKAQVIHAMRPAALLHAVPTALTTAFGKLTGETRPAAYSMKRLAGAHEALLNIDMTKWHTYKLEWREKEAIFWIDDKEVFRTPQSPSRRLGFVAWLDNQYAIATPDGTFRFGKTETESQWLEMDSVQIEQL